MGKQKIKTNGRNCSWHCKHIEVGDKINSSTSSMGAYCKLFIKSLTTYSMELQIYKRTEECIKLYGVKI